jgi:hypothetical protein
MLTSTSAVMAPKVLLMWRISRMTGVFGSRTGIAGGFICVSARAPEASLAKILPDIVYGHVGMAGIAISRADEAAGNLVGILKRLKGCGVD